MALANYSELQIAIASWLARDDLGQYIPDYIRLAEAKFNRELYCRQMETIATLTVDMGDPDYLALPTDYQSLRRIRLSDYDGKPRLFYKSPDQMDEYRYSNANAAGIPAYYTFVGDKIELGPTPEQAFTVEIAYRRTVPPLASNATNWLLTQAPDAYLYGALLEYQGFSDDDERVGKWVSGLSNAIQSLNSQTFNSNSRPGAVAISGFTP